MVPCHVLNTSEAVCISALVSPSHSTNTHAYLIVWYWQLWRDVYERLSNEAGLVGFYEGVTRDDGGGLLDLHQHIHLLQAWLHAQHAANRHSPYLQIPATLPHQCSSCQVHHIAASSPLSLSLCVHADCEAAPLCILRCMTCICITHMMNRSSCCIAMVLCMFLLHLQMRPILLIG